MPLPKEWEDMTDCWTIHNVVQEEGKNVAMVGQLRLVTGICNVTGNSVIIPIVSGVAILDVSCLKAIYGPIDDTVFKESEDLFI